jgi:hypothetical protein
VWREDERREQLRSDRRAAAFRIEGYDMKKRIAFAVGACALVMTAAACKSGTDGISGMQASSQLTSDDTLQAVAYSVGQATVADLNVIGSSATMLGFDESPAGASAPSFSLSSISPVPANASWASGCTLNPSTGRFDCPPVLTNGLTLGRSFAFYDANGNLMTSFDSTTASVNVMIVETGVRPSATGADTVNRNRNLTASGLLGHNTTRIWDGTGARTDGSFWSDSVATRSSHTQDNTTFSSIVVTLPRTRNPWPTSGSISRQAHTAGTVNRGGVMRTFTVTKSVTITFNGTEFVPMTIGNVSYTLDLATGKATRN